MSFFFFFTFLRLHFESSTLYYTGPRSTYFDETILVPTIKLRSVKSKDIDRSVAVLTSIVVSESCVVRFSIAYNIIQRDTISPNFPPLSHPDPAATCRQTPNNTHCFFTGSTVCVKLKIIVYIVLCYFRGQSVCAQSYQTNIKNSAIQMTISMA